MVDPTSKAASQQQLKPDSLFKSVAVSTETGCEAVSTGGAPKEHWRSLISALDAAGPGMLKNRQQRAERMRHEDGATFNPFDDPSGRGTPWALEVIPLPITADEWQTVENGLMQRAGILEQILADTYGPQELLKQGLLPPELVFDNPAFSRLCHGIAPPHDRYLLYYAADLYRCPDGHFRVFRDYGGAPAGLGYALENRIVISRLFPELYHKTQIRRLAPFFHTFHNTLVQRALWRKTEPDILLLSPGPNSRTYFEHALLSRYLGYPLVESEDLTVRNAKVFLKKLAGLVPVTTIFRHTPDSASDPFAQRQAEATGVAGLVQAFREQNIDLVNPIGSCFVETPVLSVFLPMLCQRLSGQNLLLENHPAWWCGTAPERDFVMANLARLVVEPALDRSMKAPPPAALAETIQATPHAFMASEPVYPATVPVWNQNSVDTRPMLLRVFACATEHGFAVMPGGLAITADDTAALTGDILERQQSKDVWVLSDQPETFSMMESLQAVPEFKRDSDLPSRVADHLLWLGRYLERAERLIRLLRSVFRRLSGEARTRDIPELPFLLNFLSAENTIPRTSADREAVPRFKELLDHLNTALYREDRPESVAAILRRVQGAALNVRDRLSLDTWRAIDRLDSFAENSASDPLELLNETLFTLSAFSGLAMESMTRGLGWRFMDMGRRMERAMNQVGLIRTGIDRICGESHSALEALLEVSDSIMTYRARYRTAFQIAPVLDLLLADETNPNSLAFQFSRLATHVEHLPPQSDRRFARAEERIALEMLTSARLLNLADLSCKADGPEILTLKHFLESTDALLKDFAQAITAHYLSRVPPTSHFSFVSGDPRP